MQPTFFSFIRGITYSVMITYVECRVFWFTFQQNTDPLWSRLQNWGVFHVKIVVMFLLAIHHLSSTTYCSRLRPWFKIATLQFTLTFHFSLVQYSHVSVHFHFLFDNRHINLAIYRTSQNNSSTRGQPGSHKNWRLVIEKTSNDEIIAVLTLKSQEKHNLSATIFVRIDNRCLGYVTELRIRSFMRENLLTVKATLCETSWNNFTSSSHFEHGYY